MSFASGGCPVDRLPGEQVAPGCTVRRRAAKVHVNVTAAPDFLHPWIETIIPFWDICLVQEGFKKHKSMFVVLTWPSYSPLTELLGDVLDNHLDRLPPPPALFCLVPDPKVHLEGSISRYLRAGWAAIGHHPLQFMSSSSR